MAESFDRMVRRTTKPEVIRRGRERGRALVAEFALNEVRLLEGMSPRELAKALGVRSMRMSARDAKIGTIRRYVESIGGELQMVVKLPGRRARTIRLSPRKGRRRAA